MTMNQLTMFPVSGHWYDVESPDPAGTTNTPQFLVISGFVTFTARLAPGSVENIPNLDLGAAAAVPSGLAVTASSTGGTLAAGTYDWQLTALTPNGETTPSPVATAVLTGTTSSATLTWNQVANASGYKLYRNIVGSSVVLVTTISDPATLAYTDTGAAGTSAVLPATNTAEISVNTSFVIAPVQARIWEGELATINTVDTPGVELVANTPILGLSSLIYDVSFNDVVYASNAQVLSNFAFTAPADATPVDLSDPALTRLPYNPTNYT